MLACGGIRPAPTMRRAPVEESAGSLPELAAPMRQMDDAAPGPPPASGRPEPSLAQAVAFLERNWPWIFGLAAAAAVLALLAILLFAPGTYRASATLVLFSPGIHSEIAPSVLSVHAYQRLLESDAVLDETRRRLTEEGLLEPDDERLLREHLDSRIFVSRREETESLAPMLEAIAEAESPELAAGLANTWVDVFLRRTRSLMQHATDGDVALVESQFPQVRADLEEREQEWVELTNDYQRRLQETASRGDRRIATYQKETADLIAAYNTESRRLMDRAVAKRLDAEGVAEGRSEVVKKLLQLASVRGQMAVTAPVLALEKAITDDALWQSLITQQAQVSDPANVENRSLLTQEVNPLYNDLALQAVQLEVDLRSLAGPQDDDVAALTSELDRLQQERSAGLAKLQVDRSLETALLRRIQNRELSELHRERTAQQDKLRRSIEKLESLEKLLRESSNQVQLTRARDDVAGVHLATAAVAPLHPEPSRTPLVALAAAVLGGLLGLAISMVLEARQRSPRR